MVLAQFGNVTGRTPGAALLKQSQSRLRPNRRLCCLDFHGVDVRHATSSAFKNIQVGQVVKS
jgi:hypothetical protein